MRQKVTTTMTTAAEHVAHAIEAHGAAAVVDAICAATKIERGAALRAASDVWVHFRARLALSPVEEFHVVSIAERGWK